MKRFKGYFFNLVFIWAAVAIYRNAEYYVNFLSYETQGTILLLAASYTVLGFFFYLRRKGVFTKTKGWLIFSFIKKVASRPLKSGTTKEERTAVLFAFVKFFYLPLMLNFFYGNAFAVIDGLRELSFSVFSIPYFNNVWFPFLVTLVFAVDTAYFAFGYAFEARFLKNKVRSVEPTFIGWFVALICYPPFNSATTRIVDWYADIYIYAPDDFSTFLLRLSILLLLGIYLSATLALGAKSSNLTNRGIVSFGPYRYIRHPAYVSKNLAWWLSLLPVMSWPAAFSMASWSLIYHARAITEERHLMKDKEYKHYCRKVRYRYFPGIY